MKVKHAVTAGLSAAGLILASSLAAFAAGQYGPGVSDTEIKLGNTMPYSGPASSYGVIGKVDAAYFAMINEQGGINGRKITFISRDDSYSPPKTVEQVRQLVEQDQVLLIFNSLGTPPNMAIHGYLNDNKVPQLFPATGADQWNDPKHFPWTMMWLPSYSIESHIYARYILKNLPNAKIAVLYQNDDFGKDYLNGLRDGLGDKAGKMIVATQSYETTDPTVDSQIVALQGERRRRAADGGHPQIRRAGDPQGLRHRLEADALPQFGRQCGRHGHEARGPRERRRHHLGGFRQRSHRPAMAGHARVQGMAGLHEQGRAVGKHHRRPGRHRLLATRKRWSRCSKPAATISPART